MEYFDSYKLHLRSLLGLALGLRGIELIGLGEKLGQRGDQVGLLRDRSVLVAHAQRTRSVVIPLASESEHNRADLRADALDLLEDRLLSLTIRRDAIDEGGEVVGRIALAEIGLRSIFGDIIEMIGDQVTQRIRDALGLGRRAVFILGFGDVLGRDLSESFAALDVVLEIAHGQNGLLKRHGALCALGSLTDMTLARGEDRIAVGVGLEHATSKGGDEFEVLSAHFDLCFLNCWLFVLGCLRFYVEPLTLSHSHQQDRQRDKALEVPSFEGELSEKVKTHSVKSGL